jgi:hypothetical protein
VECATFEVLPLRSAYVRMTTENTSLRGGAVTRLLRTTLENRPAAQSESRYDRWC